MTERNGSLHRPFKVVERIPETPKTVSLVLDGSLDCAPGQFAMLWLPGIDEKPFSIAGKDPLSFAISRVGPFSEALHELGPGETLWVRGPFGRGFSLSPGRALLVGGGYGAAPLFFLASELGTAFPGAAVEAALGARTASELLFERRFEEARIPVHAATEDGSAGAVGRVTEVVGPLLSTGRFGRVCACGPEAMLEAVAGLCRGAGVPAELSFEAYMRCGVGLCGSCEHRGRLVCMDGPVFSHDWQSVHGRDAAGPARPTPRAPGSSRSPASGFP